MNRFFLSVLALAFVATGCMSSASTSADAPGVLVGGSMMLPTQTLVQNASEASTLSTLVSAVQAAELVETLNGPGPFTVFAPTNAAFEAVPQSALQSLLQPANQAQLQAVLTYHVVAGRFSASDLRDGQTLTTVNGETLRVSISNGTVRVGNATGMATVTQANVYASNGVAHVIDAVLMP